MRKPFLLCLVFSLLFAARGSAQVPTFIAVLNGANEAPAPNDPRGTGFAVVSLDPATGTVTFTLLGVNIATPTASHIHRGPAGVAAPVVIPFNIPFVNGVSSGTVTGVSTSLINDLIANPAGFYVNIHNADFPGGAIRGQLTAAPGTFTNPVLYEAVVGKVTGAKNENFVSDQRLVNRSGATAMIAVDFFASNSGGLSAPTATQTVSVPAGSQVVLNDILGGTFSTSGIGALRITADRDVVAVSRLSNDKRGVNQGTVGMFVPAVRVGDACRSGTLPLLSHASTLDIQNGVGFRASVGYFNPNPASVTATFTVRRNDSSTLGTKTVTVRGFSHAQFSIFDLIDTVASSDRAQDDFFLSYTVTGAPLLVYAVVIDNRTGDPYFQAGVCAP